MLGDNVVDAEERLPLNSGALFLDIWAVSEYSPYEDVTEEDFARISVGDEIWLKERTQGYAHVLLYIGNKEVVHVSNVEKSGLRLGKTKICRDKLDDVAKDHLIGLRKTEGIDDKKRDEIVRRALGDVGKYFPYLLTTDNCEHQVKYWISGVKDYRWIVSTQVRDHVVLGLLFGTLGGCLGAGGVILFWSKDVLPIIIGVLGGFVGCAAIGVGFKYCMSAIEHRRMFPTSPQIPQSNQKSVELKTLK